MIKSFSVGDKRKRNQPPHVLDYVGYRPDVRRSVCVQTIAELLLSEEYSLQSVEAAISIFDRYAAASSRHFSTDDLINICMVCSMLATKLHERCFLSVAVETSEFNNMTAKQAKELELDILVSLDWKIPHEGCLLQAIDSMCSSPDWNRLTPWLQNAWVNPTVLRAYPTDVLAASILAVAMGDTHPKSNDVCITMLKRDCK